MAEQQESARLRRHDRKGLVAATLCVVAAIAMLVALVPVVTAPNASAQSAPGSAAEIQAAEVLLGELAATSGPVDPDTVTIDPALGPPPWISYVPGRSPESIEAWRELAKRAVVALPEAAMESASSLPVVTITDIEGFGESGLNDTLADGQLVAGFGTDAADTANIIGSIGMTLPPPSPPCVSEEPDGSIPLANLVERDSAPVVGCAGMIGDGEFAETSGDIDVYELSFVPAGEVIIVDAVDLAGDSLDVSIALYDAEGALLEVQRDRGPEFIAFPAPDDGAYYSLVTGTGSLPSDPFDPGSGGGVTTTATYLLFTGSLPGPGPEPTPVPTPVGPTPTALPTPGPTVPPLPTRASGSNGGTSSDRASRSDSATGTDRASGSDSGTSSDRGTGTDGTATLAAAASTAERPECGFADP